MNKYTYYIIILLFLLSSHSQEQEYRIAFYNVENLFDINNNPNTKDDDFTPESTHHWDSYKYQKKLNNIYKTLMAVKKFSDIAIIGLAEVENEKCLNNLIYKTPLYKYNIGYIHKDSPDERGIDAALLYNKDLFTVLKKEFITITFPNDSSDKTRDIIYVKGYLKASDTIHIFVNHWPSRYSGYMTTEHKRCFVASILKQKTDSLLSISPDIKILVMGDFNDPPNSKSIKILTSSKQHNLINLMEEPYHKGNTGTLKYHNEWYCFDQFLISKALLPLQKKQSIFIKDAKATICYFPFLLEDDIKYLGKKPFRTYHGPTFHDGFSDHLPIFIDIKHN